MRPLLPLAVLALLMAGCTAADDPAPPNADPNGPAPTLPPTSADNRTSTGPPTAPPTSTGSTQGPGFASHAEEDSAADDDFSGLSVHGRLAGSGDAVWVEASATKFSPARYKVPDGRCAQPWTEALLGPNGPVQPRRPLASCTAFSLRDMQDNEDISIALEWDGTLWDSGTESYVPAPAGKYVWQATFHVYSGGAGSEYNESADLALAFDVTVP